MSLSDHRERAWVALVDLELEPLQYSPPRCTISDVRKEAHFIDLVMASLSSCYKITECDTQ